MRHHPAGGGHARSGRERLGSALPERKNENEEVGAGGAAQLQAPLPSPNATVSQAIGVTKVEVVYSRPHVKGPTRVAVVCRMDTWRLSCETRDCGRLLAGMVEKGEECESGSSQRR